MRFVFTSHAWQDYNFWQTTDGSTLRRINRLLDDVARDPYRGIGKPEQLRHALAGAWSRRIDEEHRLVYLIDGDDIVIIQVRYHYG